MKNFAIAFLLITTIALAYRLGSLNVRQTQNNAISPTPFPTTIPTNSPVPTVNATSKPNVVNKNNIIECDTGECGKVKMTSAECSSSVCCQVESGEWILTKSNSECQILRNSTSRVSILGYNGESIRCDASAEGAIKDIVSKLSNVVSQRYQCDVNSEYYSQCVQSTEAEIKIYENQYNSYKNSYCS